VNFPSTAFVIPVRNGARTIRASVASILASVPAAEIVIVDDGSSDGTAEIVEKGFPGRLTILQTAGGVGPSEARNTGASHSHSEVLAFLDADDVIDVDWSEKMLPPFDDPSVLLVSALHRTITGGDTTTGLGVVRAGGARVNFMPGSFAIRRATFMELGGFWAALRYSECTELGLRFLTSHPPATGASRFLDTPVRSYHREVEGKYSSALLLSSAEAVIGRHRGILRESGSLATWHGVCAVEAARIGRMKVARRHALRSFRYSPAPRTATRLALMLVSPLARRRYRPRAADRRTVEQPVA